MSPYHAFDSPVRTPQEVCCETIQAETLPPLERPNIIVEPLTPIGVEGEAWPTWFAQSNARTQ